MLQNAGAPSNITTDEHILADVAVMSEQMRRFKSQYKPIGVKTLRKFPITEVSRLTGIPESTLRTLSLEGKGPEPERLENNHRAYSLDQINELRLLMAEQRPADALKLNPRRRPGDPLQVLTCTNFKGGSAKTTTSVHLAQYLALQGLRVLAIDLDPQASMSAMFGVTSEFDVAENESMFGCIRSDQQRARPLRDIIRKTYFAGVDLVPANLYLNTFEQEVPLQLMDRTAEHSDRFYLVISKHLSTVADDYDVVIIDTPPALGYLSLGAIFASTALIITVHPAMLDVQSMSQFLRMLADQIAIVQRLVKVPLQFDFYRYLLTRHDPNDIPQKQIEALLRHHFKDRVVGPTAIQSAAVETAVLAQKSLYEVEGGTMNRETYKRSRESMDAVNRAILDLVLTTWGRS